jgi:hypothetical protein
MIAGVRKLIALSISIAVCKDALFLENRPNPDMARMLHNIEAQCD